MQDEKQINNQNQTPQFHQQDHSDHAFQIENTQQLELPNNLFKFKTLSQQNCYLPEFRSRSKQNQVQVFYKYQEFTNDHMGNLDEKQEEKAQSSQKIGSQLMSESPNKGTQYSVLMKKIGDKKSGEGVQMRGQSAFRCENILNYFEVKVQQSLQDDSPSFEIGITSSQNPTYLKNSITFSAKFKPQGLYQIYRNKRKVEQFDGVKLQAGDVVGLGLIYHKNEVFLVVKGKKLKHRFQLWPGQESTQKIGKHNKNPIDFINLHNHKYFPFITMYSSGITVEGRFENIKKSFGWDYESQRKYLMKKCKCVSILVIENKIEKQKEINEGSVYGLVFNYLKFNGYHKSTQLLQTHMINNHIKFYPQNQPTNQASKYSQIIDQVTTPPARKDISRDKKIRKKNKNVGRERRNSSDDEGYFQFQEQNNSNSKSHSQDDGYEGGHDQMFWVNKKDVGKGKTNEDIEYEEDDESEEMVLNLRRKQRKQICELRNRKVIKKVQCFKKTQLDKFKTERIQIIRNIKQAKLQLAFKLLSKSYKRICKQEKYLQVFFKANIFLRLFYECSYVLNQKVQAVLLNLQRKRTVALQCMKTICFLSGTPSQLKTNFNTKPLREILFLISPTKPTAFQFKSHLQIFSQFVNKILCEESGFHSKSKLQLVLNHLQVAQNMVTENEISIGGLDTDSIFFA